MASTVSGCVGSSDRFADLWFYDETSGSQHFSTERYRRNGLSKGCGYNRGAFFGLNARPHKAQAFQACITQASNLGGLKGRSQTLNSLQSSDATIAPLQRQLWLVSCGIR
jgi:hypothetical protein